MSGKLVLKRGFTTEAEKISENYRKDLGTSKSGPLDAFRLAEYLDVPVYTVAEIFSGEDAAEEFSFLSDTDRFSAMWMPDSDGTKIIIHNSNHSKFRQQSNIMHELSHIIRKHEIPVEMARLCLEFNLHYYNALHEQEAKYLGGCLQITRAGLVWALKEGMSPDQISKYYSASMDMVNYRLGISGASRQRSFQLAKGSN